MITLHHISNETAVYKSTIIQLDISTQHVDSQGYRKTDGTDCGMACGISTDGYIIIYMTTNGEDLELADDIDDAIAWCYDLGDNDTGEDGDNGYRDNHERIIQGARRLLDAVEIVSKIYTSDEAQDDLDWYKDKANEVIETVTEETKNDKS